MNEKKLLIAILMLIVIIACFVIYRANITYEMKGCMTYSELTRLVKKELITFKQYEYPNDMIEYLAKYKIVMTGETHYIKENGLVLTNLMIKLHEKSNFNTLLIEMPHCFNWVYEDYVAGLLKEVDEKKMFLELHRIDILKDYNLTHESKIKVHTIDINHQKLYFTNSLKFMNSILKSKYIEDQLTKYTNHMDNELYLKALKTTLLEIKSNQSILTEQLTDNWYNRLYKMIEVEILSHNCRNLIEIGKKEQRYYEREEYIKKTVDQYLQNTTKIMLHMGSQHIKNNSNTFDIEWVGEYLSNRNLHAKNSTYSIRLCYSKGSNYRGNYNLLKLRLKNNLPVLMAKLIKNKSGFLPLQNKDFDNNLWFYINKQPLQVKNYYDGILMMPVGTYDNTIIENYN
ncbi:hypothetical protein IMX26_14340 [Clostridium sp. 'deep sea']|uniref:hypothetical protein n=1 Tax=Clostridium sp. 'deep sea' TaxID=2779445 RepID=UPI001896623B|nr:hypothetical protein [Clostridium sp. 'deep sea']QOR34637.1 hypothetical protein IMX26_14340 [Clostridium sp. 'deep sea']